MNLNNSMWNLSNGGMTLPDPMEMIEKDKLADKENMSNLMSSLSNCGMTVPDSMEMIEKDKSAEKGKGKRNLMLNSSNLGVTAPYPMKMNGKDKSAEKNRNLMSNSSNLGVTVPYPMKMNGKDKSVVKEKKKKRTVGPFLPAPDGFINIFDKDGNVVPVSTEGFPDHTNKLLTALVKHRCSPSYFESYLKEEEAKVKARAEAKAEKAKAKAKAKEEMKLLYSTDSDTEELCAIIAEAFDFSSLSLPHVKTLHELAAAVAVAVKENNVTDDRILAVSASLTKSYPTPSL